MLVLKQQRQRSGRTSQAKEALMYSEPTGQVVLFRLVHVNLPTRVCSGRIFHRYLSQLFELAEILTDFSLVCSARMDRMTLRRGSNANVQIMSESQVSEFRTSFLSHFFLHSSVAPWTSSAWSRCLHVSVFPPVASHS